MPSATLNGINIADDPTAPSFVGTTMNIGGGASTIVTASVGKDKERGYQRLMMFH